MLSYEKPPENKGFASEYAPVMPDLSNASRTDGVQAGLLRRFGQAAILMVCLVLLVMNTACAKPANKQDVQTFFTAFNHLLEANSLEATGNISTGKLRTDFHLWLDQKDQVSLALQAGSGNVDAISFYIHDGKTYLDYLGVKSSSKAENIGLKPGSKISIYNPFLDLSDSQRQDMFDKITRKDDDYTFAINKSALAKLLDSYGSCTISKAEMTCTIIGEQLKTLSLSAKGNINMDGNKADLSIDLSLDVLSMNQPVTVPFPDDLNTWPGADGSTPAASADQSQKDNTTA